MPPTTAQLRTAARRLGFEACGVAAAAPYPDAERFVSWLEDGHAADMDWLGRDPERRCDPRRVVEGCQSVVMVFMSHHPGPLPAKPTDTPRGRIARYALGLDYHDVVLARLKELAALLDDPWARCYVDTGPVLERSAARAAGLGWVGKNANFLVPQIGSYGFLGSILTCRALEPTPPPAIGCGTCARCLPACPTAAIVEPGRVDSRRCISYLTIELRGAIPRELRAPMGDWIFGCDDCQEPCPWNAKAAPGQQSALAPLADRLYPALATVLELGPDDFSTRFRGSAIKRAKRAGLARNAAVALGNSGDPAAIAPLRQAVARHDSGLVRLHAAWALGQLGDREGLTSARRTERDEAVLAEISDALGAS